jgi:serine/threonine-protein kinase
MLKEMLDSGKTPEEVCRDCPELLPEVRRRWQEFQLIDAQVRTLLPGLATRLDAGATEPPVAGLPQVPGYEVEAVLGRGGMGVVYKARHLALKRTVALKMLAAGHPHPAERARFRAEAEAVARLQHPNIVQIHEVGEADGRPFCALEYVAAGSLAERLAGEPLPARDAARLVAAVAEAMHLAHSRNLVHRDLKPGNVLLAGEADTPVGQCQPKVTDFGLVRQLDADFGQTFDGMVIGTPSYMAPEQAEGRARSAGPAADVYALGAILYDCLTGRPPFHGTTPQETLEQVRTREPASPYSLNRQIPRDLGTICLKCLRKQPEQRYSSARELADDLHRFLDGKPVLARPVGLPERAVKWVRRRPAAALLLGALLVLLGVAAGTAVWLHQQEADREAAKAQREQKARDVLDAALRRYDDLRHEERWEDAQQLLTLASPRLAEANSPLHERRFREARLDCQIAADLERARESYPLFPDGKVDYKRRARDFLKAFERTGFRIDDDPEQVAEHIRTSAIRDQLVAALEDRALVAFMLADQPLVERSLRIAQLADPGSPWRDQFRDPANWRKHEQLQELAATAFTSSPPPSEHQLALLALLLRRSAAWGQSTQLLGEACRRQPRNFWTHREMAIALSMHDRDREAAGYYRVALSLRPDNAAAHEGLAFCLTRLYQSDEAIAAFRRAVDLPPDSASTRARLVGALVNAGYWKEAESECRRALEADPSNYLAPMSLSLVLHRHGRFEEALIPARRAAQAAPNAANVHAALGAPCVKLARHEEAVRAYRRVIELKSPHFQVDHLLAQELAAMGQWEEAITGLQAAAADRPTDPRLPLEMGKIYWAHGKLEEAAEAFRNAVTHSPGEAPPLDGLIAARLRLGRFAEARTDIESRLKLPATGAERRAQRRQLDLCNSMLAIKSKLPAILAGKERPTDVATQRALAEWCLIHKRLPTTAAGFYASALSSQPSLADDLEAGNRAHAAAAAALAGCGVAADAAQLDDRRKAELRQLALDWLTAEYNVCAERHRVSKTGDRTFVATVVRSWLRDEDLAGVRDAPALAKLPSSEQRSWQDLWAKVAALAERDPIAKFEQARAHIARMEWEQAARCYAEGMELEPSDNGDLWFEYAAAQVLAGDRSGYRQTCAHMLARCQPAGPMRPYLVARACTLASDSNEQPARAAVLSKNELLERNQTEFWALTELGALAFRYNIPTNPIGYLNPVAYLEKSLVVHGRPGRAVLNWLWLALFYQKMGSPTEAQRWLDRAANWLDQQGGRMPVEDHYMGSHLHNWLEANVLRREAEALIRPAEKR